MCAAALTNASREAHPPLLRRAAERIGEIFRRPVIHGGAQEMVARADALPAARGILAGRAQAVGERGEGWRPCAGILAPHGGTRREDLAHLAAAEARGAERAHEL